MSVKILALETATEACSAALLIDDQMLERFEIAPRGHARLLLPMLDELLATAGLQPAQLDAVAFGRGPGSFTGLRIAAGTAQGIAFATDLPVLPVSTLAALARPALLRAGVEHVLAAIDARMGEVYWAPYGRSANGEPEALGAERVSAPERVDISGVPGGAAWSGVGSGWAAYAAPLHAQLGDRLAGIDADALPRAGDIARLAALDFAAGRVVAPEHAQPIYLRNQVVQRPGG
ncbi:MAG: tRNA (adenosine(37)-N6)-threonylcarbamoyltransferase complex dimerization subunit type 1 TsaB [Thiohalobacteraceae bacterium]